LHLFLLANPSLFFTISVKERWLLRWPFIPGYHIPVWKLPRSRVRAHPLNSCNNESWEAFRCIQRSVAEQTHGGYQTNQRGILFARSMDIGCRHHGAGGRVSQSRIAPRHNLSAGWISETFCLLTFGLFGIKGMKGETIMWSLSSHVEGPRNQMEGVAVATFCWLFTTRWWRRKTANAIAETIMMNESIYWLSHPYTIAFCAVIETNEPSYIAIDCPKPLVTAFTDFCSKQGRKPRF